jgi:hypothetical protein
VRIKKTLKGGATHVGFVNLEDGIGGHGHGSVTFMVPDQEGRAWIVRGVVFHLDQSSVAYLKL